MTVPKGTRACPEGSRRDHLGGTAVTSDSTGAEKSRRTYPPFGLTRTSTGAPGTDRKFTGQRMDMLGQGLEQSGLYFYNPRYYDAGIGRFVSADTFVPDAANPQALNRYSYVFNNPVRYTDPSGHCPICVVIVIAVLVDELTGPDIAYAPGPDTDIHAVPPSSQPGAVETLSERLSNAIDSPTGELAGLILPSGPAGKLEQAGVAGSKAAANAAREAGFVRFGYKELRKNLIHLTGKDPGKGFNAHHVLPDQFKDQFAAAGIHNINDPRFGTWVRSPEHQEWSRAYNDEWAQFFEANRNIKLTPDDVMRKAKELAQDNRFDGGFDVYF